MTSLPSSSLSPSASPWPPSSFLIHSHLRRYLLRHHPGKPPLLPRAVDPDTNQTPTSDSESSSSSSFSSDPFESRLSEIRLRYRSGTGKKAESRKTRKSGKKGSGSGSGVFLPPVPLQEATSSEGLKVEFGFTGYSERMNGRIAGLGLAALLVVELATGKSLISYHSPAIVFVQVYFVAAVSALYLKFQKEKVSVWPN